MTHVQTNQQTFHHGDQGLKFITNGLLPIPVQRQCDRRSPSSNYHAGGDVAQGRPRVTASESRVKGPREQPAQWPQREAEDGAPPHTQHLLSAQARVLPQDTAPEGATDSN